MKIYSYIRLRNLVSLVIAMLVLQVPFAAYSTSSDLIAREQQLITDILKEISERYEIFFAYQLSLVENKRIDFEIKREEALESVVNRLMKKTNLRFELVGEKYCILYANDKKSIKHKKKIERKILQIERLESQSHTSVLGHSAKNSAKLRSIMEVTAPRVDEITISGSVAGSEGEPLIGVNILVKGTGIGTITDYDGKYTLEVPDDATTLVFSYTGYSEQEILIEGRTVIDVVMLAGVGLDEVVVVGYGTQRKENLTGSVATVTSRDIDARPITSVATALQGTTSGVFINQNSGQPGRDNVLVRIRGVGTLNNANPLILVDGIEAPLNNINPSDIESITVLKDAASSAIYGSRAANGVILVTTKRGRVDSKPTFTLDSYLGTTEATLLPDMVTDAVQFAELRNEALTNFNETPYFTEDQINGFRSQRDKISTDWLDLVFNPAPIQQHNIGVSGGSKNTNYRISLGYLNQEGVSLASDFKRLNGRLNLDTRINDKVKIGTGIAITRGDRNSPTDDLANLGSMITHSIQALPTSPPYDDQGRYASQNPEFGNSSRGNPLPEAEAGNFNALNTDILANGYVEYEPIANLIIKGTAAINSRTQKSKTFNASVPTYDWITGEERVLNSTRSASNSHWQAFNYTLWLTAQYEKSFGNHNLKLLAGYNEEENETENFSAFRNGHLSNSVRVLNVGLASSSTNSGGATGWGLRSYFSRLNYNYQNKYLFEANVRIDGSSRFSDDKWGTFPSVSAGWVISQEDFFANVSSIDFLKLRASWGQLGNQNIGNFAFARSLSLSQGYNFGGTVVSGVAQTSLGNPALSWETATMTDIGLDIGILNTISITADYFVRRTEDVLFPVPISALTGFSEQISNASTVENVGWELGLTYNENFNGLEVSVGGNLTHVTNEVITLNPNIDIGDVDRLISGRRITQRGSPINAFYGLESIGIFQTQAEVDAAPDHSGLNSNFGPGDLIFKDQNGDGVIDADDRVVLGKEDPTWTYGFNLRAGYKGFDIAAIFQGAADFDSYGGEELSDPFFNNAGLPTRWVDRWTPQNTDTDIPRLYFSNGPSNSMANSFFVYDRSYFRLKNLQIGYTIPDATMSRIGFTGGRVYVNGSNLFTKTDFPFFDPERPAGADRGATGFPNIKVLSAGVSLSF